MEQKMSREELIDLTETIMARYNKTTKRMLTDEEFDKLLMKFKNSINHSRGTDLIFYPELVGLSDNPSVYEIVDLAMKGIPGNDFYHNIDDTGNLRKYEFLESEEITTKQKMSREELIDLTEALMTMYNKTTKRLLTEKEQDALAVKFDKSINHPGVILVRTPLPTTTIAHRCAANHFATPSV
jgi:hypothetical protein